MKGFLHHISLDHLLRLALAELVFLLTRVQLRERFSDHFSVDVMFRYRSDSSGSAM